MFAEFQAWVKMRSRLLEGYDEIECAHKAEIDEAFENDSRMQAIIKEWKEEYDEDTVFDMEGDLYMRFADRWLVDHGYAFVDPIQGVLPIKWKSIPREQWGEVFDPTTINLYPPR